jgi:hypothetical protein
MVDVNNNRLVAAHLTQALIAKLPIEDLSAVRAVQLFRELLEELDGMRKEIELPNAILEPIHEDLIHEQWLERVRRLSMMRIMARRTKAATVVV